MNVPITEVTLRHDGAELARVSLPPGEYIIGRSHEVQISVNTPLLSRQHARLTIHDDHILLEDLGSSNGTFIGEQPISEPARLEPHHDIRLGDVALEVRREQTPTERTERGGSSRDVIRRFLPDEFLTDKRHTVGKIVASGGMGAILDAHQTTTQRTVAMKVMLDTTDESDVVRFIEEAQVTAQLEHPNIVPVHEIGVDDQDQLFYTMKMVRGITLKKILDLLRQGVEATVKKYQLPALLTVFQKACDAVAFAHSKGVIHRDLKPDNIMIGDYGEVLVMDWGLAKVIGKQDTVAASIRQTVTSARATGRDLSSTLAGTIMGTPHYMAPEQARGEIETLDGRADIYSLGVVLFEMLYLRHPVPGEVLQEVLTKVREGLIEWPDPRRSARLKEHRHLPGGRAPESLIAVCHKALALDPTRRYQRVEELQADLEAYQHGFATSAEKITLFKSIGMLIRRKKIECAAAALVLLAVGGFGAKAVIAGHQAEQALRTLKQTAPDLLRLAESDANFQNYAAAQKNIEAALAVDPTLKDGYWRRAWVLLAQEQFAEAAAAIRLAQNKDPARANRGRILPQVEQLAAAQTEAERRDTGLITTIFNHLRDVGASGESAYFTRHLRLKTQERIALLRPRIEAWLGKDGGSVMSTTTGFLQVRIQPGAASSLDGLRGLAFDILEAGNCKISTLEPLRGMRLAKIAANGNPISDLTPLAGMSLFELNLSGTEVSDLSPLAGAPLQIIDLQNTLVNDVAPLHGAPLEKIVASYTRIVDFSPLTTAPLKEVILNNGRAADLRFLAEAPVKILNMNACGGIQDLAPLRGRPLVRLEMNGSNVADISPLRGLPLKNLSIDNCKRVNDFSVLLELPALERVSCIGTPQALPVLRKHPTLKMINYQLSGERSVTDRPVAAFWPLYDAKVGPGQP